MSERVETWTSCIDCGWSLATPKNTEITELLPAEHPCPACGEPVKEQVEVEQLRRALREHLADSDPILDAVLHPLAPYPEAEDAS